MIRYRLSLLVFALLLAGSEAALRLGRAAYWRSPAHHALATPQLLVDRLEALSRPAPRKRLLLLGDSVFAGSALREHKVPGWRGRTVGAQLAELPAWQGWDVVDFSADGLYPADLRALAAAAAAAKPDAVVLELNYRMFCDAAGQSATAYSRPWLAAWLPGQPTAPSTLEQRLDGGLARACALYRYAALARDLCWQPSINDVLSRWISELYPARATAVPVEEMLLDLKIRPYYAAPAMGPGHLGLLALRALAQDLTARRVPVLVFLTPQNHDRVDGMLDRPAWAANRKAAAMAFAVPSKLLRYEDWADRRLPGQFLDHCHPDPEGCGALAAWITRELKP